MARSNLTAQGASGPFEEENGHGEWQRYGLCGIGQVEFFNDLFESVDLGGTLMFSSTIFPRADRAEGSLFGDLNGLARLQPPLCQFEDFGASLPFALKEWIKQSINQVLCLFRLRCDHEGEVEIPIHVHDGRAGLLRGSLWRYLPRHLPRVLEIILKALPPVSAPVN